MKNPNGTIGNRARDQLSHCYDISHKTKTQSRSIEKEAIKLTKCQQSGTVMAHSLCRYSYVLNSQTFSRQTLSVVPRTTTSIRTLASDLRSIKSIHAKRGHSKSTSFKHRQLDVYNLPCSILCAQLFLLPLLVYHREYGPSQLQQYARITNTLWRVHVTTASVETQQCIL